MIRTNSPTLKAIARLCRLIHTASASPMLVIKAPWARIVAINTRTPKSRAASETSR